MAVYIFAKKFNRTLWIINTTNDSLGTVVFNMVHNISLRHFKLAKLTNLQNFLAISAQVLLQVNSHNVSSAVSANLESVLTLKEAVCLNIFSDDPFWTCIVGAMQQFEFTSLFVRFNQTKRHSLIAPMLSIFTAQLDQVFQLVFIWN